MAAAVRQQRGHGPQQQHAQPGQRRQRQRIQREGAAVALMEEYSSVIRRPIVENEAGEILVGFDPTLFDSFVR